MSHPAAWQRPTSSSTGRGIDGDADQDTARAGGRWIRRGAYAVTATTTNVNPNFAYQYRLVATNTLGSYVGQFNSFTISPPAPPAPAPPPSGRGGGGGGSGSLNLA